MTQDARPRLFEPEPVLDVPVVEVVETSPVTGVVVDDEPPVDEAVPRRVNPWAVALWIAAVVLTVASVAGYMAGLEQQFNGYSYYGQDTGMPFDFKVASTIASFAPGAFAVGLGCALAAASIHALTWMRRHS